MAIDLDVHGNTRPLESAVQAAVNRIRRKPIKIIVDDKGATQPLGNMKRGADEFSKSMEAANARILAFGASMAIINGVGNAFKQMVGNVIEVEKALADINVVMGLSTQKLEEFSDGLFKAAKETGQAFKIASNAAVEYARQGLGVEESLKRTRDALILTRLTGMESAEAVKALTAAMNTYGSQIDDTTQLVSKFAAVDVQFAVSAEDFADAIARTGQSAKSAGVDIDELIGIVTAAQQQTARGGKVIGNSLKTIFTRIGRTDTLNQLENLGIAVRDVEGNTLGATRILTDLANTFDHLSEAQKAQIAQTVGGVFQINILKAVLSDAAKQNGILARATDISSNATDEAIQKNDELRNTFSALATETGLALKEMSVAIGEVALAPGMEKILNTFKSFAEGANELLGEGESAGSKFANGFLAGLGNILTGPGLVVLTAVFFKLFGSAVKFTKESLTSLMGITTEAQKQKAIQTSLVTLFSQNAELGERMLRTDISRTEKEKIILGLIKAQVAEAKMLNTVAQQAASTLYRQGFGANLTPRKNKATGHIPNFASKNSTRGKREKEEARESGYSAGAIRSQALPGEGLITYNTAETIKKFPGIKETAIMPPMQSKAGEKYKTGFEEIHGFDPYEAGGLATNFGSRNQKTVPLERIRKLSQSKEVDKRQSSNLMSPAQTFQSGVEQSGSKNQRTPPKERTAQADESGSKNQTSAPQDRTVEQPGSKNQKLTPKTLDQGELQVGSKNQRTPPKERTAQADEPGSKNQTSAPQDRAVEQPGSKNQKLTPRERREDVTEMGSKNQISKPQERQVQIDESGSKNQTTPARERQAEEPGSKNQKLTPRERREDVTEMGSKNQISKPQERQVQIDESGSKNQTTPSRERQVEQPGSQNQVKPIDPKAANQTQNFNTILNNKILPQAESIDGNNYKQAFEKINGFNPYVSKSIFSDTVSGMGGVGPQVAARKNIEKEDATSIEDKIIKSGSKNQTTPPEERIFEGPQKGSKNQNQEPDDRQLEIEKTGSKNQILTPKKQTEAISEIGSKNQTTETIPLERDFEMQKRGSKNQTTEPEDRRFETKEIGSKNQRKSTTFKIRPAKEFKLDQEPKNYPNPETKDGERYKMGFMSLNKNDPYRTKSKVSNFSYEDEEKEKNKPKYALGFIPNFYQGSRNQRLAPKERQPDDASIFEAMGFAGAGLVPAAAQEERSQALKAGYAPGAVKTMSMPGEGQVYYNSAEQVKTFPGMSQPAIMPPAQSRAGKVYQQEFSNKHGFNPYAAEGYIPNYAAYTVLKKSRSEGLLTKEGEQADLSGWKQDEINRLIASGHIAKVTTTSQLKDAGQIYNKSGKMVLFAASAQGGGSYAGGDREKNIIYLNPNATKGDSKFSTTNKKNMIPVNVPYFTIGANDEQRAKNDPKIKNKIEGDLLFQAQETTNSLVDQLFGLDARGSSLAEAQIQKTDISAATGNIFEKIIMAVEKSVGAEAYDPDPPGNALLDIPRRGRDRLWQLFGAGALGSIGAEAKIALGSGSDAAHLKSAAEKFYKIDSYKGPGGKKAKAFAPGGRVQAKASGYIPNFANPLSDAINREKHAGVPVSQIRVDSHAALVNRENPLGLGVTNTRDEPNGLRDVFGASGFVPNYANPLTAPIDWIKNTNFYKQMETGSRSVEDHEKLLEESNKNRKKLLKHEQKLERIIAKNNQIIDSSNKSQQRKLSATNLSYRLEEALNNTKKQRIQAEQRATSAASGGAGFAGKIGRGGARLSRMFSGNAGMAMMMGAPMAAGYLQSGGAEKGGFAYNAGGAMQGAATGGMMATMIAPFFGPAAPFVVAAGALYGAFDGWVSASEENTKALNERNKRLGETQQNSMIQALSSIIQGSELSSDMSRMKNVEEQSRVLGVKGSSVGDALIEAYSVISKRSSDPVDLYSISDNAPKINFGSYGQLGKEDFFEYFAKEPEDKRDKYGVKYIPASERPNYLAEIRKDERSGKNGKYSMIPERLKNYNMSMAFDEFSYQSQGAGKERFEAAKSIRNNLVDYFMQNEKSNVFSFNFGQQGKDEKDTVIENLTREEYAKVLKGEEIVRDNKKLKVDPGKASSVIVPKLKKIQDDYIKAETERTEAVILQLNLEKAMIASRQAAKDAQFAIKEKFLKQNTMLDLQEKMLSGFLSEETKARIKYTKSLNKITEAYELGSDEAKRSFKTGVLDDLAKSGGSVQQTLRQALYERATKDMTDPEKASYNAKHSITDSSVSVLSMNKMLEEMNNQELETFLRSIRANQTEINLILEKRNSLLDNQNSDLEKTRDSATNILDLEKAINDVINRRKDQMKEVNRELDKYVQGLDHAAKMRDLNLEGMDIEFSKGGFKTTPEKIEYERSKLPMKIKGVREQYEKMGIDRISGLNEEYGLGMTKEQIINAAKEPSLLMDSEDNSRYTSSKIESMKEFLRNTDQRSEDIKSKISNSEQKISGFNIQREQAESRRVKARDDLLFSEGISTDKAASIEKQMKQEESVIEKTDKNIEKEEALLDKLKKEQQKINETLENRSQLEKEILESEQDLNDKIQKAVSGREKENEQLEKKIENMRAAIQAQQDEWNRMTGENRFAEGLKDGGKQLREDTALIDYNLTKKIPQNLADGLAQAMKAGIEGAEDMGDVLTDIGISFLGMIRDAMLQKTANMIVGSFFSNGGKVNNYSDGGRVKNFSNGGSVPARVTNGEYVMGREAVNRYGTAFMHNINNRGSVPGFANGGEVPGGTIVDNMLAPMREQQAKKQEALRSAVENHLISKGDIRTENTYAGPVAEGSALAANFGGGRGFKSGRAYQSMQMSGEFYGRAENVGLQEDIGAMNSILQEEERIRQEAERRRQEKKAKRRQLLMTAVSAGIGVVANAALDGILNAGSGKLSSAAKEAGFTNKDIGGFGKDAVIGKDLKTGTTQLFSSSDAVPKNWVSTPARNQRFSLSNLFKQQPKPMWQMSQGPKSLGEYFSQPIDSRYFGGPIRGYMGGGHVSGKSGIDQIPAMLSNGEYVIKASSARKMGKPMLDNINAGKFNEGGPVSSDNQSSESKIAGGSTNNINITINMAEGGSGKGSEKSEKSNKSGQNSEEHASGYQRQKAFADRIKLQVVQVIREEQRPGGMLHSNSDN